MTIGEEGTWVKFEKNCTQDSHEDLVELRKKSESASEYFGDYTCLFFFLSF